MRLINRISKEFLLGRIERRLAARGLSERQACLNAGLKVDAIRNIRRGRAPRADTLLALARALACPADYLLDADGADAGSALRHAQSADRRQLPLRSRAGGIGLNPVMLAPDAEFRPAPPPVDRTSAPEAFAAIAQSDAPPPLKPGDLVICDPAIPCAAGDLCLAEQVDGSYQVGILAAIDAVGVSLQLAGRMARIPIAALLRLHRVIELRLH